MKNYRTKSQRKIWWERLPADKKAAYVRKWEHERDKPEKPPLDVKPLTKEKMKEINDRMRELGIGDQIVLPE